MTDEEAARAETSASARRRRRRRPQPTPLPPRSGGESSPKRNHSGGEGETKRADDGHRGDRGLRELVGSGSSQLGVDGALRGRDVNRPSADDLAEAEQTVTIVRRHWKPPAGR
jgi:hypothetical protein